ncbi:MAG: YfhO family protein [Proteobacteria bacterium]|nr:YfhO family protein [Pseudomonadota bacterium]
MFAIDADDALALLFAQGGGMGIPRGTIVIGARGDSRPSTTMPEPCAIRAWNPGELALACTASRDGYAVVSSSHARGWSVTVDGADATPLQADAIRRAVAVAKGIHAVQWTYRAPGFRIGLSIAIVGLAALALVSLGTRRR